MRIGGPSGAAVGGLVVIAMALVGTGLLIVFATDKTVGTGLIILGVALLILLALWYGIAKYQQRTPPPAPIVPPPHGAGMSIRAGDATSGSKGGDVIIKGGDAGPGGSGGSVSIRGGDAIRTTAAPPSASPPSSERLPDGRVVYNVTPEYLTAFFEGKTTAQANREVAIWIGRLMRFSGTVRNVYDRASWATVVFAREQAHSTLLVLASFRTKEAIDRVTVLGRGERLTVIGRIDQVESDNVRLEDCELVE